MPQATENETVTDGLLNYKVYIVGARLLAGGALKQCTQLLSQSHVHH